MISTPARKTKQDDRWHVHGPQLSDGAEISARSKFSAFQYVSFHKEFVICLASIRRPFHQISCPYDRPGRFIARCVRCGTKTRVHLISHALCQFLLSRHAEKVDLCLFVYVESPGCRELSATALHADCTSQPKRTRRWRAPRDRPASMPIPERAPTGLTRAGCRRG